MGKTANFFGAMSNAIAKIASKIGTFILFVFTIGAFFGAYVAVFKSPFYLLIPLISMLVMYRDLDQGLAFFIILMFFAFIF